MKSMQLQVDQHELHLDGCVNFDNVVSVCQKGIDLIGKMEVQKVTINLKKLQQSDSSALALFSAWVRSSYEKKKDIVFVHVPDFMRDIIKVCGLEGVLPILWES